MYDIKDEDINLVASQSYLSAPQSTPLQIQLTVIELPKVSRFFLVADNIFESRHLFYLLLIWFLKFPDFVCPPVNNCASSCFIYSLHVLVNCGSGGSPT